MIRVKEIRPSAALRKENAYAAMGISLIARNACIWDIFSEMDEPFTEAGDVRSLLKENETLRKLLEIAIVKKGG